jgi:Zinc finger domain
VLCAFFKAGQCTKGDKCKFSHDLSIGRKAEKRSMYDDQREGGENGESITWFVHSLLLKCSSSDTKSFYFFIRVMKSNHRSTG